MAHEHQHVDLVTLEEVHELLAKTEFASIHDLAGGVDLVDLAGSLDRTRATVTPNPPPAAPGTLPPLPRRH